MLLFVQNDYVLSCGEGLLACFALLPRVYSSINTSSSSWSSLASSSHTSCPCSLLPAALASLSAASAFLPHEASAETGSAQLSHASPAAVHLRTPSSIWSSSGRPPSSSPPAYSSRHARQLPSAGSWSMLAPVHLWSAMSCASQGESKSSWARAAATTARGRKSASFILVDLVTCSVAVQLFFMRTLWRLLAWCT